MWRVFGSVIFALAMAQEARAYQSFKIAAMTRGFDVNTTDPEVLGGTSHDCYRTCVAGDVRTCVYSFTIVEYTSMSRLCGDCPYTVDDCYNVGCITAGGHIRSITVANHMLPGPSIQVCAGDSVHVDIINALSMESTTIHWHGIHQLTTPFMDGTPFLTQCPILPHNSFLYNFTADPAGTHIWHSHVGFAEADGLYGSLIVRMADDPLSQYYDFDLAEHVMIVWHWYYSTSASVLKNALHRSDSVIGYSLIINGFAATVEFDNNGTIFKTPRAEFTVATGYRYRFRVIKNSAVYCPIQLSIDDHTLLVIASEGGTFDPVEVDSLVINSGERFDFVLTADQAVGNYWIRYRGLGDCISNSLNVTSEAILRYEGSDVAADPPGSIEYEDGMRSGVVLNPVQVANGSFVNETMILLTDLNSSLPVQPNVSGTPANIIYMQYSYNYYYEFHSPGPFPQINFVSFEYPPIPLLTQYDEITDDMYCTELDNSSQECVGNYCSCPYVYPVATDSLVELVIVDEGLDRFDDHPMHLHGHNFQVVAMESIGESISIEEVRRRNEAGLIDKKLVGAISKDNVGIPAQGFLILRFIANNPGYWFFHCHISNHAEMGMGIVIKVGEHSEMSQPPDSFPTCGNWNMTKVSRSSTTSTSSPSAYRSSGHAFLILHMLVIFILKYVLPINQFSLNLSRTFYDW